MNLERRFRQLRAEAVNCPCWDSKQKVCMGPSRCDCMDVARRALKQLSADRPAPKVTP